MHKNSESRERVLKVSKKDTKVSSLGKDEVSEDNNVNDLRPKIFSDYVGQELVVESIEIAVAAAKKRNEPLDHSLFHGPPGLGKTTIAHIIARQIGSQLIHTSGPALDRPADVVGLLSNLKRSDVLFIDEIHRLSSSVEEYLYSAMEDFRVDFVTGSGAFAKTINLPLLPFTLIGSTTRVGMLSAPLRERFGLTYHLDYYSSDELSKVIIRSAGILNLEINLNSAKEIAKRLISSMPYILKSKGTVGSLKGIMNCYGIPSSILRVREYGGIQKSNQRDSFEISRKFTKALGFRGAQYVSSSWADDSTSGRKPETVELRFRSVDSSDQVLIQKDDNWAIKLKDNGSTDNKGTVAFMLTGSFGLQEIKIKTSFLSA